MINPAVFTEDINMEQKLLQALSAHYNAKLQRAEANLFNYFKNSAGIGEHPDIVEEMIKQVDEIAAARDGLEILTSMTQQREPDSEEDDN